MGGKKKIFKWVQTIVYGLMDILMQNAHIETIIYIIIIVHLWLFFCSDADDPYKLTEETRMLGLVVCRGTSVVLICPVEGMESIPNPFVAHETWKCWLIILYMKGI